MHITELREITELLVQRNDYLASLLIHMEKQNNFFKHTRDIIRKQICYPINSKNGIKLS